MKEHCSSAAVCHHLATDRAIGAAILEYRARLGHLHSQKSDYSKLGVWHELNVGLLRNLSDDFIAQFSERGCGGSTNLGRGRHLSQPGCSEELLQGSSCSHPQLAFRLTPSSGSGSGHTPPRISHSLAVVPAHYPAPDTCLQAHT